jgi:acyl carrier protein
LGRDEIISRLVGLIKDAFDVDNIEYSDSLTADDIEEWDSLSNIRFMVSVEKAFGIRFTTGEIEGFKNTGELVDTIAAKLG